MNATGTQIEVASVAKRFGPHQVLQNVDLLVQPGELLALLGPSGSGKTTLLRIVAGLEHADEGTVQFDRDDAQRRRPCERGVGFVFQHYALFRHMTVARNVGFGLSVRKLPRAQIDAKVADLLRLVQLEQWADRYPSQLSGGQRQRVALARALAVQPRVLLLDEPFGALDAVVRRDLRRWLRRLHRELSITTIFVTHDQAEAFELADRVVLMNAGRIAQAGTPLDVYREPADEFVMRFLGEANAMPCESRNGVLTGPGGFVIGRVEEIEACLSGTAYIRPRHVRLRPAAGGVWRVTDIVPGAESARVIIARGDTTLDADMPIERLFGASLRPGVEVDVSFSAGRMFFTNTAVRPRDIMPMQCVSDSHHATEAASP